ncbi:Ni2+-binding GTPase involved in maturation of urease and hydrogenase [Azomonas agilis]|uniref:Hydrogenase maturation factor HypB n=1 Tax=Azomonas agilis TaxID=116849 RepID=A0A562ILC7_9GAMM|nr:GTP-binding protein [Azomonas agilis]TWH71493.1 Ni2+-binding GTPase involved in maturation of urease and hydrogenase [Azomonas agilis]
MKLITLAGPPSSGKTSLALKVMQQLRDTGLRCGVVKFDCLSSRDGERYQEAGFPALTGLAGNTCPDHFFVSNIEDCARWGHEQQLDVLISESAGLCNRCAPHIRGLYAVCVLDNLSGVDTPRKVGPMLKTADLVIITKGDIVSQAEREVFAHRVRQVNAKARILFANGITGQGSWEISRLWANAAEDDSLSGGQLRFSLPSAVCSYCFGQTKIGRDFQRGVVRRMNIEEDGSHD